jgi:hypothetical protein
LLITTAGLCFIIMLSLICVSNAQTQMIENGGFETGDSTGWISTGDIIEHVSVDGSYPLGHYYCRGGGTQDFGQPVRASQVNFWSSAINQLTGNYVTLTVTFTDGTTDEERCWTSGPWVGGSLPIDNTKLFTRISLTGANIDQVSLMGETGLSPPHATFRYTRLSWDRLRFDPGFSYAVGGDIISCEWFFGDGEVDITPSDDVVVEHVYENQGSFTVTLIVTDDSGLSDSYSMNVEILAPAPIAMFTETYYSGNQLRFNPRDSTGNLIKYEWDFESDGDIDFTSDESERVFHRFESEREFTVTLKVTDDLGASDEYSKTYDIVFWRVGDRVIEYALWTVSVAALLLAIYNLRTKRRKIPP